MKKFLTLFAFLFVFAIPAVAAFVDFFNGVKLDTALPSADLQYIGTAPAMSDRVLLIDFWATWCEPCRTSIPKLNDWHEKFSSKGLVVIGVSQESRDVVVPFLTKLPMHYPVATEGSTSLHKALSIKALPYAIFVDRTGKIVWRGQPSDISDELIASLLSK